MMVELEIGDRCGKKWKNVYCTDDGDLKYLKRKLILGHRVFSPESHDVVNGTIQLTLAYKFRRSF